MAFNVVPEVLMKPFGLDVATGAMMKIRLKFTLKYTFLFDNIGREESDDLKGMQLYGTI